MNVISASLISPPRQVSIIIRKVYTVMPDHSNVKNVEKHLKGKMFWKFILIISIAMVFILVTSVTKSLNPNFLLNTTWRPMTFKISIRVKYVEEDSLLEPSWRCTWILTQEKHPTSAQVKAVSNRFIPAINFLTIKSNVKSTLTFSLVCNHWIRNYLSESFVSPWRWWRAAAATQQGSFGTFVSRICSRISRW